MEARMRKEARETQTAGQAHARAMGDALILLDLVRDELIDQASADRQEGIHEAHAGSAEHYRELLREALMQIKGADDEEAALAQIEKQIAARRA